MPIAYDQVPAGDPLPDRWPRLSEFIDGLSKVREDSLTAYGVREGKPVPYRYVVDTYDGSECWLLFAHTLEDARSACEGSITDDIPWAPGTILDLDTGYKWTTTVTVNVHPLRYGVEYAYSGGAWYTSRETAEQQVAHLRGCGVEAEIFDRGAPPHQKVAAGRCPVCGHYGTDCVGE
jgi:hypothetical protein